MVKFILPLLIALLNGCAIGNELIYSFPIDANSLEEQIFELDGIRSKKVFTMYSGYIGPYSIFLCIDDDTTYNSRKVEYSINLKSERFEYHKEDYLYASGYNCWDYNKDGWPIKYFGVPSNFDLGKKVTLSFQILKDSTKYLAETTNPRLMIFAGKGFLEK